MNVKAITGYFPAFQAKHLSEAQFRGYGDQLQAVLGPYLRTFGEGYVLRDCWAHRFLERNPNLMPSDRAPAPDRFATPQDMVASNIAILQRFSWLLMAMVSEPEVDQWVWLEYTIMKQPGVTAAVIKQFMDDVYHKEFPAVSIPGCWNKAPVDDGAICWRFVGSVWVCPRQLVIDFVKAAQNVISLRTENTGTISWDVNTLAFVELMNIVPIRWYPGNHDASQLTNYLGAPHA
jgi:hypothetical protein